nr:peptide-binding protein [Bacillus sp. FJAT-47783]
MFNGLVDINDKGEPIPDLAERWESSDGGKKWTFKLREDVLWHDGEPFTAEDVEFTYNIPLNKGYNGPRGSYFSNFKEIKALNDYTVEISLKEPSTQFISRTTPYYILPKHILGDVPISDLGEAEFNTKNPIGTGPFKFKEWKKGQYVKFVANEDYYEGRPYLDSLTYKIVPDTNALLSQFQAGDINYMSVSADDVPAAQTLVERGEATLTSVLSASWNWIAYNERNPLFQDKKVRQALTHGLNREEIIKFVLDGNGEPAHTAGIPFSWAYNEDIPKFNYDPDKAKQLLLEAGWEDTNGDGILDKDGKDFKFTLMVSNGNKARQQVVEIAQQQWKKIGIKITPKVLETSAFLEQIGPPDFEYDAYVSALSVSLDPSVTTIFHTNEAENGLNRIKYSNPELDQLMEKSDHSTNRDERKAMVEKIQEMIAEDQPYTFLYHPIDNMLYTPKLHGVKEHPGNSYFKIHKWWMEQ